MIAHPSCLAGLALLTGLALAAPARADGEFAQLDLAGDGVTAVVSVARGALSYGIARSGYDDGFNWTVSVTGALPFDLAGAPATLRAGPALQYDSDDGWTPGLKAVVEQYRATGWGGVFLLADVSTIRQGYFVMAQINLAQPRLGMELVAQGDDGYRERSVAATYRFGDSPFGLRLGYKVRAEEPFIGLSFNTF